MEVQQRPVILVGAGALGILFGQRLTAAYGTDRVAFAAEPARAELSVPLSSDATESPVYFGSWMMWPMPPRRG